MKRGKFVISGFVVIGIMITIFMFQYNKDIPDSELLRAEFMEIESMISYRDVGTPEVSEANVAWHLDHTLKVINNIVDTLNASDPNLFESDINMARTFVWSTGKIPRGRGKAPASALPPDSISTSDLYLQIERAKKNIELIASIQDDQYFVHSVFGNLEAQSQFH